MGPEALKAAEPSTRCEMRQVTHRIGTHMPIGSCVATPLRTKNAAERARAFAKPMFIGNHPDSCRKVSSPSCSQPCAPDNARVPHVHRCCTRSAEAISNSAEFA